MSLCSSINGLDREIFSGASFSENFYGMKRIYLATGKSPIDFRSRIRNLMLLVLWPYVRDKFDKWHMEWTDRLWYAPAMTRVKIGSSNKAGKDFSASLAVAEKDADTSNDDSPFRVRTKYISNRSAVHSPFLLLAGVRLEKLTQQDMDLFKKIPMHLQSSGVLNRVWQYFLALPGVFSRLFGYGLFFVQFIDFMYNTDFGLQMRKKHAYGQIPPAPHKLLTESSVQLLDTNKCPLCLNRRKNDTALSVSGYVFCFTCIDSHVKNFRRLVSVL
ncbi:Pex2 / Pex12 amino terminal region [Cooperia oncophora]